MSTRATLAVPRYIIHFLRSRRQIVWDSSIHAGQSIMDRADQEKLFLRRGCATGYCKACRHTLVTGSATPSCDTRLPCTDGIIYTCCYQPSSDLVIDA